jgi:hypothetical protein
MSTSNPPVVITETPAQAQTAAKTAATQAKGIGQFQSTLARSVAAGRTHFVDEMDLVPELDDGAHTRPAPMIDELR